MFKDPHRKLWSETDFRNRLASSRSPQPSECFFRLRTSWLNCRAFLCNPHDNPMVSTKDWQCLTPTWSFVKIRPLPSTVSFASSVNLRNTDGSSGSRLPVVDIISLFASYPLLEEKPHLPHAFRLGFLVFLLKDQYPVLPSPVLFAESNWSRLWIVPGRILPTAVSGAHHHVFSVLFQSCFLDLGPCGIYWPWGHFLTAPRYI